MSQETSSDENVGLVLHDSYSITRKIGEGGMGAIYEAGHVRLGKKRFAIKFLHPSVAEKQDIYIRFKREAEIATELGHPNIIDVIDFNVTDRGQPYMVMEFLEGEDLGFRLYQRGRLQLHEVIQIVGETSSALQAAHDHDIIHRDMKPENIFLAESSPTRFHVKVLDFGISKIRHSKTMLTSSNTVFGTPYYMSPEQARGDVGQIDHRSDIFAMGAIAYQMLCGMLPFDAPTIPGVVYKVCHEHPQPVAEMVPGLPRGVDGVLSTAMAKHRADRYRKISDFAADLAAAIAGARPTDSGLPGTCKRRVSIPSDIVKPVNEVDAEDSTPAVGETPSLGGRADMFRVEPVSKEEHPEDRQATLSDAVGEAAPQQRHKRRRFFTSAVVGGPIAGFVVIGVLVLATKQRVDKTLEGPGEPVQTAAAPRTAPLPPVRKVAPPAPVLDDGSVGTEKGKAAEPRERKRSATRMVKLAAGKSAAAGRSKGDKKLGGDAAEEGVWDPMGYLIANTNPWSRVWVDGKDTKRITPITKSAMLPLRPGRHKISFVTKDGRRFDFEVMIEAGKVARLAKRLSNDG